MKKIAFVLLFKFVAMICNSQVREISFIDNTGPIDSYLFSSFNKGELKVYSQFVIPIESDGISINNGISLSIKGPTDNISFNIMLQDIKPLSPYFINQALIVNSGAASYDLTFNGANLSTVYRIIIWNNTTNSEVNYSYKVSGHIYPREYYIVLERNKTGTFANRSSNFKYKINWVDYWLNNHPNPAQFKIDAEEALTKTIT
jgi:hypothetical protein